MKTIPYLLCSILVLLGGSTCQLDAAETSATNQGDQRKQAERIVRAAQAFLDSLNEGERTKAIFDFDDQEQRARWSNLPVTMAERRGLRTGDLTEKQNELVVALLAATLSKMGYEKIVGIVESDEALKIAGGRSMFGRDQFYISFLGEPSISEPWMLQFGGHHLGLNVTFVGEEGVLTPSLIAIQPASFTLNGKMFRPLGRETDKAFELVNSLNEDQRKEAILGFQMRDLVLGPGHDGESIQPEGLKASAMTDAQKKSLIELISEWAGIIHEAEAAEKMNEIQSNLGETWFAWSGPTETAGTAYFRVQGPTVIIEYAPQRLGGDVTQHLHTMYRDPTNDYGKKLLEP